jgi:hypothetical protein
MTRCGLAPCNWTCRHVQLHGCLAALCLLLVVCVPASAAPTAPSRLPGAKALPSCGGAGPYWPTMTVAAYGRSAWVACKEQSRLVRIDMRRGARSATVALGGPVIAVASGFGSIWALDTSSTLYRIAPGSARVSKRIPLGAGAPYNIWIGAGSVWVVDDRSGQLVRISASTNRVVARLAVGDGPADMVFDGPRAWVINHRDRGLVGVNAADNTVRRIATIPGDAPERMVRAAGRLWVTGRGTDLLAVDPESGAVLQTIDIGVSGIDVIAAGGAVWVPTRSAAVDPSGLPTMDALQRVDPATGTVTTPARPTGRLDVHGLAATGGDLLIADNRSGVLYRFPT